MYHSPKIMEHVLYTILQYNQYRFPIYYDFKNLQVNSSGRLVLQVLARNMQEITQLPKTMFPTNLGPKQFEAILNPYNFLSNLYVKLRIMYFRVEGTMASRLYCMANVTFFSVRLSHLQSQYECRKSTSRHVVRSVTGYGFMVSP